MRKILLPATLVLIVGNSCKKDEDPDVHAGFGVVVDAGSPALDGCGWLIKIDTITYFPVTLSESFQKNELEVQVLYKALNEKQPCGFSYDGFGHKKIKILFIIKNP